MKYYVVFSFAAALVLTGIAPASSRAQDTGLSVHEWGTFTSLQDETGRAIGGINTDDEPVPRFVHDVAGSLLLAPTELPPVLLKGAPGCHPDVTMRLETPVLYFHAPEAFHGPVDVRVAFNGGWLTQFYPQAAATNPGIDNVSHFGPLTAQTVGKLVWSGLGINTDGDGPSTDEHVWLSPRAVRASGVKTREGEQEKFLFYRGVGHLDAPLRVKRSADGKFLNVLPGDTLAAGPLPIGKLWLVDIRPDGTAAYRTLAPDTTGRSANAPIVTTPSGFAPGDYAAATVEQLRVDLRTALVADGLFADEADALLNTWEISYFKSAGLRLFFLVPRAWTDRVLPLTVSGAPPTTRVMVGRIELVTPQQRALLANIAAGGTADAQALGQTVNVWGQSGENRAKWQDLYTGKLSLAKAGVALPATYRAYLELGRFRNALLLDAEHRDGNANLAAFIKAFGLEGYSVPWYATLTR